MRSSRPLTVFAVALSSASGLWACATDVYQRVPGRFVATGTEPVFRVDARDLGGAHGGLARGGAHADLAVRDEGVSRLARTLPGLRLEIGGVVRCWCGSSACELYPTAVLVPPAVAAREAEASPWTACRRCGILRDASVSWFGFGRPEGRARTLSSQGRITYSSVGWGAIEPVDLPPSYQALVARCPHSWLPLQGLRGRSALPPFVFTSQADFDVQTSWLRLLLDLHERAARLARDGGREGGPGATPPEVLLRRLVLAADLLRRRLCRTEAPVPFLPEDLRPTWERPWFDHVGFPLNFLEWGLEPVASWLIDDSEGGASVYDVPGAPIGEAR